MVRAVDAVLTARPDLDARSLTVIVYGWAALPPATLASMKRHCGEDLCAFEIFGQTESISCHRFWPDEWPELYAATAPQHNYVGVPSPVLASTVLDPDGRDLASQPGVAGEAVYRSPGMMAGYYRDKEATRHAFRYGWFHSGDSCAYDDAGLRVMLDRYKDIVKTGGENVSSLRVEAVLAQHPDVAKAAVIGLPHPHWSEAVTAVVVLRDGAAGQRGRPDQALPGQPGRVRDPQIGGVRRRAARDRGRQGAQVPAARRPRRPLPGRRPVGKTWHAGHVNQEPPPRSRFGRLQRAAERRHVPLLTILVTVGVVVTVYLTGKLLYRIKDILLLILVAGFIALLLNPIVILVQRHLVPRRGPAVAIVTLLATLVFIGLAVAFGYPLVNGITHLADQLPTYVANAQHGRGWIGHLVTKYHIQSWVQRNTPKLVSYAQSLSKPALSIGAGALSLLIELLTIFFLVLMLLIEAPKMRAWILRQMRPERAAKATAVAAEVNQAVAGYMLGNLLTSLIAGIMVFVTLMLLGVPYPLLWGLWVALVDFLPMIGGALAGIPTALFAFTHSLLAGIVTAIVFLAYQQVENHILNPVIMAKTVKISPLLVLIAVLVGASLGSLVGGLFGGFVAALLAIPAAGALQVLVREAWQATAPPPGQSPPSEPDVPAAAR